MDNASSYSFPEPPRPQPTGRLLVRLAPGADAKTLGSAVANTMGLKTAVTAREVEGSAAPLEEASNAGVAVVLEEFRIAIVPVPAGENARDRAVRRKQVEVELRYLYKGPLREST